MNMEREDEHVLVTDADLAAQPGLAGRLPERPAAPAGPVHQAGDRREPRHGQPLSGHLAIEPADCGCGGAATATAKWPAVTLEEPFVYVVGQLMYDFGTRTRFDSLNQFVDGSIHGRNPLTEPLTLLRHLFGWVETPEQGGAIEHKAHPYDAKSVLWVLQRDELPLYAIRPQGPYAEMAYAELAGFLGDQHDIKTPQSPLGTISLDLDHRRPAAGPSAMAEAAAAPEGFTPGAAEPLPTTAAPVPRSGRRAERVAIAGTITGTVQLLNGEIVPVINPDMRGTSTWNTLDFGGKIQEMVNGAAGQGGDDLVENIILRLDEEARNWGITPEERARNFASTQLLDVADRLRNDPALVKMLGNLENANIDAVEVRASQFHRRNSDTYDVEIYFYDAQNINRSRVVLIMTVDVNDTVPVYLGSRFFRRR